MADLDRYRKMDVSEEIAIKLPAHVWMGYISAYSSSDWSQSDASVIAYAAQEQMLDPVYLRERLAELQQHRDMHSGLFARLAGAAGLPPDDPRNDA